MTFLTTCSSNLSVQGKHQTGRREEDLIPCPILKMYRTEAIRMLCFLHALPGLPGRAGDSDSSSLVGEVGEDAQCGSKSPFWLKR